MVKGGVDVQIDIEPTLQNIGNKFRRLNIRGATQEALEVFAFGIERQAKKAAPVLTGRLRSSIMTDIGNMTARIKPHVNYAGFVHEGTRYMSARPFMLAGLKSAEAVIFKGHNPFSAALMKELKDKLGSFSVGSLQTASQSTDLTAYENALNANPPDVSTLESLSSKHSGDARFQIHKSIL